MKGKMKNDINVEGSGEMRRWGRRKFGEVVGRWEGKGERKVGEV